MSAISRLRRCYLSYLVQNKLLQVILEAESGSLATRRHRADLLSRGPNDLDGRFFGGLLDLLALLLPAHGQLVLPGLPFALEGDRRRRLIGGLGGKAREADPQRLLHEGD